MIASTRTPASFRPAEEDVVRPLDRDAAPARRARRPRRAPRGPPRAPRGARAPADTAERRSTEKRRPSPGGDTQARPRRPRPAVCSSATQVVPCARASLGGRASPRRSSTSSRRGGCGRPSGDRRARRTTRRGVGQVRARRPRDSRLEVEPDVRGVDGVSERSDGDDVDAARAAPRRARG